MTSKGFPVLADHRGAAPADLETLQHILLTLSAFVASTPEIKEIDLNPIYAYTRGALAVDARVVLEARHQLRLCAVNTPRVPYEACAWQAGRWRKRESCRQLTAWRRGWRGRYCSRVHLVGLSHALCIGELRGNAGAGLILRESVL